MILVNGQTKAAVIIGNNPTWIEQYAAQELVRYIKEISGAQLKIVNTENEVSKGVDNIILIGRSETNRKIAELYDKGQIKLSMDYPGLDGFIIKSVRKDNKNYLVLGGSIDRGTLYAVYHFLEEVLKVGFFEDGEYIPKRQVIEFDQIRLEERPYFPIRQILQHTTMLYTPPLWNLSQWKKEIDWLVKKKFNTAMLVLHYCSQEPELAVIRERVFKRFGVKAVKDKRFASDNSYKRYRIELVKEVHKYARQRGIRIVSPGTTANVPEEFREKYPDVHYITTGWGAAGNLPKEYHIHPSDPMFVEFLKTFIEEHNKIFGTDHIYNFNSYPETNPGATPKKKKGIRVGFACGVTKAIKATDPKGIWFMDGWTFVESTYWSGNEKAFLEATPRNMFYVTDCWAEREPVYKRLNYFYGRDWGFAVVHTFGGNSQLHGHLSDLIRRVKELTTDVNAKRCKGFYNNPETIQHNFLYYDLCVKLAWNPKKVNLNEFLKDYTIRRYGEKSMPRMIKAMVEISNSVYANNECYPPLYHFSISDASALDPNIIKRFPFILNLRRAIKIMMEEKEKQKENERYQIDLIDICRTYIGELLNYYLFRLTNVFIQEDKRLFDKTTRLINSCLDNLEKLLLTHKNYLLDTEIQRSKNIPGTDFVKLVKNIKARFSFLSLAWGNSWESYPLLLDYAYADFFELVKFYYRKRINCYIESLRDKINRKESIVPSLEIDAKYKNVVYDFLEKPLKVSPRKCVQSTRSIVRKILKDNDLTITKREVEITQKRDYFVVANGGFEKKRMDWYTTATNFKVDATKENSHSGTYSLHFYCSPEDSGPKIFSCSQDVLIKDDFTVSIHYYLKNFSSKANAYLKIEGYGLYARYKRMQTLYWWGGENTDWHDARIDETGAYMSIGHQVDSTTGKWLSLTVNPKKDVTRIHGKGAWESLKVSYIGIILGAWASSDGNNQIEGYFDDIIVNGISS